MAGWDQVKWTQARQVADQMKLDPASLDDPGADPKSGYLKLRNDSKVDVAVRYLGHALPRLEAVAWAAKLLRGWSRTADPGLPERQALDCVMRWLEEPTDEYRRAAQEAAERAGDKSAERLLGYAVFMSGGSISQPDLPAVQPAQQVCGALASSAVLVAAYRTDDPKAALASACDVGEKVAELGVKALAAK